LHELIGTSSEGHWRPRFIHPLLVSLLLCGTALATITLPASARQYATPAQDLAANGCPPERGDQSYLCPAPSGTSSSLIEYLYSDRRTDAIAIRLTPEGVEQALTCEGAADISSMVIDLYDHVPREERARDSIEWARPHMIDEIRAHARLGQIPDLRASSNPVDIVFSHYGGASSAAPGGLWDFSQQVVFGSLGNCS
jgi:hypothetical protein